MTGFVGALIEAWDELRIHKLRVLLALVGVTVAVTAITAVTALVDMFGQAVQEQMERQGGRFVTLQLNAYPMSADVMTVDPAPFEQAVEQAVARYGIDYAARTLYGMVPVRLPGGTGQVESQAVDPELGVINRVVPIEGRWLTRADDEAFAPRLVVNEAFLAALGVDDLSTHPTVLIGAEPPVRATVVGVIADRWEQDQPMAYWSYTQLQRWYQPDPAYGPPIPAYSLWVPTDQADALSAAIQRDVGSSLDGWQVQVYDNRMNGDSGLDSATRWVGLGVGTFALLLGGLGLVNISLVTVRYRIREIGIRRSFGATSARIFLGVVLESAVATMVAGAVGVALAITLIKALPVEQVLGYGIQDLPPFPLSAALTGLGAALAVGLLAGVIPANRAVRVKVIDAIRY